MKNEPSRGDSEMKELETIKRLLVLMLIKAGASQDELAMALQTDRSVISRMLPAKKIKRFGGQ